jgi:hypothetical protein
MPRTANGSLSVERIRELARAGAEVALNRLKAEIAAIEKTFPELATPAGRRSTVAAARSTSRRARRMSASARKAVSERMKRYWAERRKGQSKSK